MNIAIDCRYIGKSGIGRVCEGILGELDYEKDTFYLIGNRSRLQAFTKAHIIEDDTDPYSVSGLFSFDKTLNKLCDALVIPNFLVPYGVKIPVHTIMHDLAFLDVKETTRGFLDKQIKKFLLKRCMKKSASIACDSQFTLDRCKHFYGKLTEKCYVNYIGLSKSLLSYAEGSVPAAKENSIVFVGNVKPHKGLSTLLAAFSLLNDGTVLRIIGQKEGFLSGMDIDEAQLNNVIFTGRIDDDVLFEEISRAKFLVLPSKYEGFGLPPLEALYLGTKPIVSDIPVFREVYEGLDVIFFEGGNAEDLADKLKAEASEVGTSRTAIVEKYNYSSTVVNLLQHVAANDGEGIS